MHFTVTTLSVQDETLFRSMNPIGMGDAGEDKLDPSAEAGSDVQEPTQRMADLTSALEDLEESVKNMLVQQDDNSNGNQKDAGDEANDCQVPHSTVDDMIWLAFPRAGNTFGARFELPIDLRKLKSTIF